MDGWLGRRGLIVLMESSSNFSSLDANNRIVARGVIVGPLEDFHSYGALFEQLGMAIQLVLDNKPEELLAASRASEKATFQDVLEFVEDLLLFLVFQWMLRGKPQSDRALIGQMLASISTLNAHRRGAITTDRFFFGTGTTGKFRERHYAHTDRKSTRSELQSLR